MRAPHLIRVGIIGYGYAAKTFHAPLIAATPGFSLAVVASRDPVKVRADYPYVKAVADPLVLLASKEVDLVVIATPNDTHLPLARAALTAGKAVVVDKPFTLTLRDARELIAAAERSKCLISAFHNRRWDSDYLSVRAAIADGRVGPVVHFESHFDRYRPEVRKRWRENDVPGGGVWFDLGPHLIDQALQLFGLPDRVVASFAKQRPGSQVEDWSHAILEYPSRRVILHAMMVAAGGFQRFLVHGLKGSLVKHKPDQQEAQLLAGMSPGAPGWGADADGTMYYDGSGASIVCSALAGDQRSYYRDLGAALRGEAANPVTPAQILGVMAVIEAAIVSAQRGESIKLTLDADERGAFARDTKPVQP